MSSRVTEASVRALAEGVKESKENANNLVDLLDYLQVRTFCNFSQFLLTDDPLMVGQPSPSRRGPEW